MTPLHYLKFHVELDEKNIMSSYIARGLQKIIHECLVIAATIETKIPSKKNVASHAKILHKFYLIQFSLCQTS